MYRNQFSAPKISGDECILSRTRNDCPIEFRKYACNGGNVHTFSDIGIGTEHKGITRVIHVRNPEFDKMENLV